MSFRKKILNPFFFILNIISALGFVLALLAPYVSPDTLSFFAFAATGFPLLLLINVLFLIWWMVQFNKRIALPLLTLLLGYFAIGKTFRHADAYQEIRAEDKLSIMTYNVRSFNRYEWLKIPDVPQRISKLIRAEDPDIVLFQEYHRNSGIDLSDYPYQAFGEHNNGSVAGLSIFSKLPLVNSENIRLDEQNATTNLLRTHINWKGMDISLYNIHLASVGLEEPDYATLKNPDYEQSEHLKTGIKKIIIRLHRAYKRRAQQVSILKNILDEEEGTVILGGDFNDVPQSFPYRIISKSLNDSYTHGGAGGFGNTFARGPIPLRIDYLWHSNNLRSVNYHVPKQELSDHFPLIVDFVELP